MTNAGWTNTKKILCVVGPTASGKSALAVRLAHLFDGEVISCDSMQLYRGMDIGTAKATEEEKDGIAHHLLDILDIHDSFSVSDYVKRAAACVEELALRGKTPIFCGGTGLYIDSFISGLPFNEYEPKEGLREELALFAEQNGAAALHARLAELDPVCAGTIEVQNVKRVIRALEICLSTGEPMSVWQERAKANAKPRDAVYIGLTFSDRQTLYERIDKRVDGMMKAGLLEETERLIRKGLRETPTAGQAIGYKEFYPYFDGVSSLEECIERLKINSRHYAKRQMTWFKRNPDIRFFEVDTMPPEVLEREVYAFCKSELEHLDKTVACTDEKSRRSGGHE